MILHYYIISKLRRTAYLKKSSLFAGVHQYDLSLVALGTACSSGVLRTPLSHAAPRAPSSRSYGKYSIQLALQSACESGVRSTPLEQAFSRVHARLSTVVLLRSAMIFFKQPFFLYSRYQCYHGMVLVRSREHYCIVQTSIENLLYLFLIYGVQTKLVDF